MEYRGTTNNANDLTNRSAIGSLISGGFAYTTTAPTAANTDGIKVVVLTAEPETKYDGWLYLITEA